MKMIVRLFLGLALAGSGRSALATPVEGLAYQKCWVDYWDTYDLWCDIWVSAPGQGAHFLVENGIHPAWSPDGSKIAFSRFNPGFGVEVLDLVSGTVTSIASGRGPAWSPDGSKILLNDGPEFGNLVLVNADGTGAAPLTSSADIQGRPAWSPDGTRIAYGCLGTSGNRDICTMNPDGSGIVQLTDTPDADSDPAYSPDGTLIAFTTHRPDREISVMTSAGADLHLLGYYGYSPAWSPDGARIIFGSPYQGACQADGYLCYDLLFEVNADGTGEAGLGTGSHPSWTASAQLVQPVARFSWGCSGGTCDFSSTSWDLNGIIVATAWDFGDGTMGSGAMASRLYAASGTYDVTLTVTDNDGLTAAVMRPANVVVYVPPVPPVASFTFACTEGECAFDATGSSDPNGTITSYAWDFGDGTTGSGHPASHVYSASGTYLVRLTVTDDEGLTATAVRSIAIVYPQPPNAAFTVACTEGQCAFDATGSSDPNGTITSYAWAFGDGAVGTGATASHTYAAAGTYTAQLTVTDNEGLSNTASRLVTVSIPRSHVGDLDGTISSPSGLWTARVTAVVHDRTEARVSNATLTGTWSIGGSSSCTTTMGGECTVSRPSIPNRTRSVTFTVTGVTHATLPYVAAESHDPDGDSTGRAITLTR